MKNILRKCYNYIDSSLEYKGEEKQMIKFLKQIQLSTNQCILDVGCGYGRNMILVKENMPHLQIEGVDINPHIIETNRQNGLQCYTVEEFQQSKKQYDCIVFSHVVEHFMPEDLKGFLEGYLAHLKAGGHIIIATPVLWKGFYWDFDHIKMYHPIGINMVFGNESAQVQYYGKAHLILGDIWFRKTPYMVHYKRGLYVTDVWSKIWLIVNLLYKIVFKFSFSILGKTTGWMGLYKKL
jgi:2-polyprenyl-3-methyl-5-hydroxy-6-metoxy-1,4-benzoquinol methylase